MKLEEQVCSLELAKKLKELGVKQDGHFSYYRHKPTSNSTNIQWRFNYVPALGILVDEVSAFTVAELGEMLPTNCYTQRYLSENHPTTEDNKEYIEAMKLNNWYCIQYEDDMDKLSGCPTEANARAKMLIYLIKNDLMDKN